MHAGVRCKALLHKRFRHRCRWVLAGCGPEFCPWQQPGQLLGSTALSWCAERRCRTTRARPPNSAVTRPACSARRVFGKRQRPSPRELRRHTPVVVPSRVDGAAAVRQIVEIVMRPMALAIAVISVAAVEVHASWESGLLTVLTYAIWLSKQWTRSHVLTRIWGLASLVQIVNLEGGTTCRTFGVG